MSVVSGLLIEAAVKPFRCFSGVLTLPLPFKTVCFFIFTFGAVEAQILAFGFLECPSHYMLQDGFIMILLEPCTTLAPSSLI